MDYAFAPGGTAQDRRVRELFGRRANTTVVFRRRLRTMRGFVNHIDTEPSITFPIDDVLVGAHANSEGQLFMPMFPGQRGPTQFETLQEAIDDAAKSVALSDASIGYTAGDPVTHSVHFKGCNLGKALPFIAKFKEALGEHVNVTAPRHFHGVTPSRPHGSFEYMAYEFSIRQDRDFASRADLLDAFDAAGFTYIDGTAVPTADWGPLVPRRIGRTVRLQERATLGAAIGRLTTIFVPRQFRVDRLPFTWTITFPRPSDVPAPAGRQAAFEDSLRNDDKDRFSDLHEFPMYERLGYATFDDFIDGYRWRHTKSGRRLVTRGTRTEYTIVVVIKDRTTGHLIFNFHPRSGTSFPAMTTALQETDSDYFASA